MAMKATVKRPSRKRFAKSPSNTTTEKRSQTSRPTAPAPANAVCPRSLSMIATERSHSTSYVCNQASQCAAMRVRSWWMLARVVLDERGIPVIEPMDMARVRCRLTDVANFFTMKRSDGGFIQVGTFPPKQLAENILAQEEWDLPPLAGIARSPILHSDGTIFTTAGYDPISRLKYCPDPSLNLKPIPEYPLAKKYVHAWISY